jgi:hypothetical protein
MNTTEHTIDIIAVAEVENRTVLLDLAKHKAIRNFGPWQIIHFDSPDRRGIDCGALINLSTTRVILSKPITYSSGNFKTRDALLLVSRSASQKDSIDLTSVIVHLPSKRGGALKSEPFRKKALLAVLAELDCDSAQNQLIVGDFNDVSTADYFQNIIDSGWTAPGFSHPKNIDGTYKFQGRWQHIDLALYRSKRKYLGRILAPAILLETDTKWGGYKPKRAYLGPFYTYGYSDHLPVYLFHVND